MQLYHLTTKDNIHDILKHGLIPKIGERASRIDEQTARIYLCDQQSIPYWQIILNLSTILLIQNLQKSSVEEWKYSKYREYTCKQPISPDNISVSNIHITDEQRIHAMQDLCINHMLNVSSFTVLCARYYHDNPLQQPNTELLQTLKRQAKIISVNSPQLNFTALTNQEIKQALKREGDSGGYTFCDTYCNTKTTLLEKLIEYPDDELSKMRHKIYNIMTSCLDPECLHVNTGGWTG